MNKSDIENIKKPLKKILSYKPKEVPGKPAEQPSKAQLEQAYKYDGKRIVEA